MYYDIDMEKMSDAILHIIHFPGLGFLYLFTWKMLYSPELKSRIPNTNIYFLWCVWDIVLLYTCIYLRFNHKDLHI